MRHEVRLWKSAASPSANNMSADKWLLAHYHAESAAPAFSQTHANNREFRREITQEIVRRWMEAQRGGNEIDEWRCLLQFNSRKIAVASDVSAL